MSSFSGIPSGRASPSLPRPTSLPPGPPRSICALFKRCPQRLSFIFTVLGGKLATSTAAVRTVGRARNFPQLPPGCRRWCSRDVHHCLTEEWLAFQVSLIPVSSGMLSNVSSSRFSLTENKRAAPIKTRTVELCRRENRGRVSFLIW